MTRKIPSFILFALGLLSGILLYWLINISFISRAENSADAFRIIATSNIENCDQITNIKDKKSIDIRCRVERRQTHKGLKYQVKFKVQVTTDADGKAARVVLENKLNPGKNQDKEDTNYITEADYCSDCFDPVTLDIKDLSDVSLALTNKIADMLDVEEKNIEEALDESYEFERKKKELEDKIANCEVSKDSSIIHTRKIQPAEKIECRRDQAANIKNAKARTDFFNETIKPDLWYLAAQDRPLDKSFFLSSYMQELKSPDFFSHEYWSVRSAIDTIEKYNDLRIFTDQLEGDHKLAALNAISTQLPTYFHTNNTPAGQQDRILLESAWNKNFTKRPFPSYYSLSQSASPVRQSGNGISAAQFRAIVNSPEFQNLYR